MLRVTRALLPKLIDSGLIVTVTSIAAIEVVRRRRRLHRCQHAQGALHRVRAARRTAGKPVRSPEIAPGAVETEFAGPPTATSYARTRFTPA